MNFHFIHGFLGSSTDWHFLIDKFKPHKLYFHSIEKFILENSNQNDSFYSWAHAFNEHVFNNFNHENEKNNLVGYSLGGRLALHALFENDFWNNALIISANPGLFHENDKVTRIQNDEIWSNRFLYENWESVTLDWNAQGVFAGQKNKIQKLEKDFDRKLLSKLLTQFSLGKQNDLRSKIKNYNKKITWMAGELDLKFVKIAQEMSFLNKNSNSIIMPGVGHRAPWENSQLFIEILEKFVISNYI